MAAPQAEAVAKAASTPSYTLMAAPATVPMAAQLATLPWFWALWALPLIALVVGWVGLRSVRTATTRNAERRRTHAASDALRALRAAPTAATAQKALDDYLAGALGRPVGGLTRAGRAALLEERGVPALLQARVEECFMMGERARFSPADLTESAADAEPAAAMRSEIEALIRDLDPLLRVAAVKAVSPAASGAATQPAGATGGVQ